MMRRAVLTALLCAVSSLHGAPTQPPGYTNPVLCSGCHPAIAKTWHQNGMGRSFSTPKPEILVEDFEKNNHYFHPASDTHYEMLRRDGKLIQRRYQIGFDGNQSNIDEKTIDFIIGSGNHMRTYVHRNADGTLAELPLAWYSEKGGYWAMNPGYDTATYPYARRLIGYDCMFCHNAYPATPAGHDKAGDRPVYSGQLPDGIDCQRCHGPGQHHVDVASTPGAAKQAIRAAIANPSHLSAERQLEVCAQCHLKTTEYRLPHAIKRYERGDFSYRPGEPLSSFVLAFAESPDPKRKPLFETASAVTRMRESRCFIQSKGKLSCTTCHDPHDIRHGSEAQAQYNAVCRNCHATAFQTRVASGRHTLAGNCVDCHMPKRRAEDIVHMVMTDHLIQRRKPSGDLLADIPEHHENDATAYHGAVVPYYPERLPATPDAQFYLALAQVRDKADLTRGIPQLERSIAALHPQRPEPFVELAEALRAAGKMKPAIAAYRQALFIDPAYVPALLEISAVYKDSGQPVLAATAAKSATQAAPSDAGAWNQLGQVALDLGQFPVALDALKRALQFDPEMPEAHNATGIALAQSGSPDKAEPDFREAIRVTPNYGEAHGNLANLLAWKQDFRQAGYEFDKAVRLQPTDAAARFNYGSMLNSLRRFDEAQIQLEAALQANPAFAEAHDLLGTLYERKGMSGEALKEYSEAVRLRPELSHAQLDLGAVLSNKGDKAGAAEHLRLAAKSTDPALRAMAQRLLQELGTSK